MEELQQLIMFDNWYCKRKLRNTKTTIGFLIQDLLQERLICINHKSLQDMNLHNNVFETHLEL